MECKKYDFMRTAVIVSSRVRLVKSVYRYLLSQPYLQSMKPKIKMNDLRFVYAFT